MLVADLILVINRVYRNLCDEGVGSETIGPYLR